MADQKHLILLPGLMCTGDLWRQQIEALSDLATVHVADLTRSDSMPGMARDVLEDAPERFALAGLSMGGYVAQEIMRRAPERVERLALLDTQARADTPERREGRARYIAMARAGHLNDVIDEFLPMMMNPAAPFGPEMEERVRTMCRTVGAEAFVRQQTAIMNRPDGLTDLGRIRCPTLVLCGRHDQPTPVEMHQEMAAAIPGARLVVIHCGHLAPMERPEEVNVEIRDWLVPE